MNRKQAKQIARSGITVGQVKAMLAKAYDAGAADDRRSRINQGLTKATAYNIFWSAYKDEPDDKVIRGLGDEIGASNALREFGDFGEWEIEMPKRRKLPIPYHEPAIEGPVFDDMPDPDGLPF